MVLAAATANAQDSTPRSVAEADDIRHQVATVVVDGDALYDVVGISGLPAETRAERVADRIERVAEANTDPPVADIRETEFGPGIFVGDTRIDVVSIIDSEAEGLRDQNALATFRASLIVDAIEQFRERRTPEAIQRGILFAVAWSAGFIVFCVTLALLFRLFIRRAYARIERWVKVVEEKTGKLAETDVIVSVIRLTLWIVAALLFLLALYYYLSQVMFAFPGSRGLAKDLIAFLTQPLITLALGAVALIPDILVLAVIYFLTRYILKIVRLVFVNLDIGVIHVRGFQPAWTWPTYRILRVVVIIFAIVVAYPYIPGSGTTAFQGISIFLGIVLSLGSSSVISNVLAGLFVIYRRSINEGDLIEVNGYVGRVETIVMLETILRTPMNELVSIPNSKLLSSELRNYSKPGRAGGVMISTKVGIGYEEPQRKIEEMLMEAVKRTGGLRNQPPPVVLRSELADFAVVYELRVSPQKIDTFPTVKSALHANILDVFDERRVQIMTPAYENDPAEPKIPPLEKSEPEPQPPAPSA